MHRMIVQPRKGYIVDHIDHNGLNNRRSNLRVCTPRQHQANRGPSRFVGVFFEKRGGKWQAHIMAHGKHYYLGLFDDEVKAAKARDRKAYELHGEFAYLTFSRGFSRQTQEEHHGSFFRRQDPPAVRARSPEQCLGRRRNATLIA
jgi:hypothetical protein